MDSVISEMFSKLSLSKDVDVSSVVSTVTAEPRTINPIFSHLIKQTELTTKGSEDIISGSLKVFEGLSSECMPIAEPYICLHFSTFLNLAGHKHVKVRSAAEAAVKVFANKLSSNAVSLVLGSIYPLTQVGVAWQTRQLALKTIVSLTDTSPEQVGFELPQIVPQVTNSMSETKKEVAKAAHEAMTAVCDVIGNRDIEHMTSKIVRSITNPEDVPEIMHALAGVTFVQSVQAPALAMVVPLLLRGLRSKLTATRRQSAVIIDNMSKLVDDPLDAAPFLPILMPALAISAENMSDPEAREVSEKASAQLSKLSVLCEKAKLRTKEVDHKLVLAAVKSKFPEANNSENENENAPPRPAGKGPQVKNNENNDNGNNNGRIEFRHRTRKLLRLRK